MSKILRKCLSLVLAVMLLASLSLNGALRVSADNKTGDGLAAYAMTAYNEGWKYVWGGASYGAVDCSGLIYSYVGGGARVTEDMLYSSPESGYVSNGVPDIPGLGLWQPGHVGVYVGGGMAVDARDEISNVCYESVANKSWVMWFKVAGVAYGGDASVAKDDQSDKTASKVQDTKPAEKPDNTLKLTSVGSEVNALQERLKSLGYFTDNTTEYFGYVTKGALEDFQSEAGLSVTGVYDDATRKALESDNAPSKAAPAAEEITEQEETTATDSEQSEGSDVIEPEQPEEKTAEIGGEDVSDTESESDPETDEDDAEEAAVDIPKEKTVGESSGDPDEESAAFAGDAVYEPGDTAPELFEIQYILIKLGYFDYDITGEFCENTADAVENFRCDFDLGDERYLDEATLETIYNVYNGSLTAVNDALEPLYAEVQAKGYDQTDEEDEQQIAEDSENAGTSESTDEETQEEVQEEKQEEPVEQSVTVTLGENGIVAAAQEEDDTDNNVSEDSVQSQTEEIAESSDSDTDKQGEKGNNTKPQTDDSSAKTQSVQSSEVVKSPKTGDNTLNEMVQAGMKIFLTPEFALILAFVSFIVIFFAGTIRYWNVSMEKRKQRARFETTVSVYRRSSM